MWGQKAPSKHENGGKKRPQNHKVGAESAPAQIRAEKVWRQKVPSKCKSGGKKRRQNSKVTAKSATTQISEKKAMVAESAIKMEKWWRKKSSPNLCVNSSFSYVVLPTLLLSSRDLTEWSLVYHSTLSYQRFYDLHSIHYDHLEGLHQLI